MKLLFPAAIVVFIGLIAAAVITPNYIDWGKHQDYIAAKVADMSGMPAAKVSGKIEIKTLPSPKISIGKIELLPHQGEEKVAVIDNLRAEFSWKTLFSLSLKPKYIRAESVNINLVKLDEDEANYLPKRHSRRISSNAPSSLYPLGGFGDVTIDKFVITMTDKPTSTTRTLETKQLAVTSSSLSDTTINAAGMLNQQPFSVNGTLDLSSLRQVPVDLSMTLADSRLELKGTAFDPFYKPMYTGALSARFSTIAAPFDALDLSVPKAVEQSKKISNISFKTNVMVNDNEIALNEIVTALNTPADGAKDDGTRRETFEGNILYKYRTSQKPANLNVTLKGRNINLSQFFSAATGDGGKKADDWSDAPFDLSLLGGLTFDLRFNGQSITFAENTYDSLTMRVMNTNSSLTVEDITADANGGTMKFSGVYNHAATTPDLQARIRIRNMPLTSITKGGISKTLRGDVTGNFDFKSRGMSEKALISNLNGDGELHVTDGALVGMKLKDTVTAMKKLFKRNEADEKTDFSNMSLTFNMKDGTLSNEDFFLHSPKAALKGSGKIDFVNWTINYTVRPQLDTSMADVLVPVKITGNLSSPAIVPVVTSATGKGAAIGALIGGPIGAGIGALIGSQTSKDNKAPEQKDPLTTEEINALKEQVEEQLENPLPFELENATPEDVRKFLESEQE